MKKYTIELKRYPNSPIGYGVMYPLDYFNYEQKAIDFCLGNDYIFNNARLREEYYQYTDGRFICSTGWSGGGDKLSHEYFCGCEYTPEKIKKPWTFGDKVVYLDVYYSDRDDVLEENRNLKQELASLYRKYHEQ